MCALEVRTLDPERDLDVFVALSNQARMSTVSREQWLEADARAHGRRLRVSFVGESDERVVAVAGVADDDFGQDSVSAWIATETEHRRRGHGRAMMAAVDQVIAERRPAEVRTGVRDDDPESRAWAERRGFVLFDHTFRSRLDLDTFDPSRHHDAVERAEGAGLRFAQFGPEDDPDRLYELFVRLVGDVPDEVEPPDRAYFQREVVERTGAITVVAYDGEAPAGLALLIPLDAAEYLNALTGVVPEYRGRGLARALKVVSGEAARHAGRRHLVTNNNARNAPMLAVNDALGYRREAGIHHLRRLRK
jgi:GNAT superfamily N-acetyltransferase